MELRNLALELSFPGFLNHASKGLLGRDEWIIADDLIDDEMEYDPAELRRLLEFWSEKIMDHREGMNIQMFSVGYDFSPPNSDKTAIVVIGKDAQGHHHILEVRRVED